MSALILFYTFNLFQKDGLFFGTWYLVLGIWNLDFYVS